MNLGKLLAKPVQLAKDNPTAVLMLAGLLAPKLAAKVAPKIATAIAVSKAVR